MQQAESLSLDEIESFRDGCGSVEFQAGSRAGKYALVEGVLKRHHYADQTRAVKGLPRRFLSKLSGLSRAQLTRLIGQFLREKCVRPTAYRRRRFPTKYSRADIVLLAHVDQVQQRLSGPATRRILQREFQIYNRKEFERLAELSGDTSTTCANAPSIGGTVCISTRLDRHPWRSANAANPSRAGVPDTCASTPCTRPNRNGKRGPTPSTWSTK